MNQAGKFIRMTSRENIPVSYLLHLQAFCHHVCAQIGETGGRFPWLDQPVWQINKRQKENVSNIYSDCGFAQIVLPESMFNNAFVNSPRKRNQLLWYIHIRIKGKNWVVVVLLFPRAWIIVLLSILLEKNRKRKSFNQENLIIYRDIGIVEYQISWIIHWDGWNKLP